MYSSASLQALQLHYQKGRLDSSTLCIKLDEAQLLLDVEGELEPVRFTFDELLACCDASYKQNKWIL
jgi:hypothetical protein